MNYITVKLNPGTTKILNNNGNPNIAITVIGYQLIS